MSSRESSDYSDRPTLPPPGPPPNDDTGQRYSDRPLSGPVLNPIIILVGRNGGQDKTHIARLVVDTWPDKVRFIPNLTDREPRADDRPGEFEYITTEALQELHTADKLLERMVRNETTYGRTLAAFQRVASEYIGIAVMSVEGARAVRRKQIPCVILYLSGPLPAKNGHAPPPEDLRVHETILLRPGKRSSQTASVRVRKVCSQLLKGIHPTIGEYRRHSLPPVI